MIKCPICGTEFVPFTAGRPKQYCSDNCKNYFKFKNALEKTISALELDKESTSMIRGDMFRIANSITYGTKSSSHLKASR